MRNPEHPKVNLEVVMMEGHLQEFVSLHPCLLRNVVVLIDSAACQSMGRL